MAEQIRYAVRRDNVSGDRRSYWWHTSNHTRNDFERDWEKRHLFTDQAGALAVIWKGREGDPKGTHFTYHLVRVRRQFEEQPTPASNSTVQPEARLL
jgi:hypothetical protein